MKPQQLVATLRRHLASYPDAADSLEGIRQWWLPDTLRAAPAEVLRDALESLLATGEMQRRPLPDGTALYAAADGDGGQEHSKRSPVCQ